MEINALKKFTLSLLYKIIKKLPNISVLFRKKKLVIIKIILSPVDNVIPDNYQRTSKPDFFIYGWFNQVNGISCGSDLTLLALLKNSVTPHENITFSELKIRIIKQLKKSG